MDVRHNQGVARSTADHKKGHKGKRKDDGSLKVVYISSPMKVRTSASKFRSLVQELTGKNSDIAQYMDGDGAAFEFHDDRREVLATKTSGHQMVCSDRTASTAAFDSFLGSTDNVFASQMVDQFGGISPDLYFGASSHLDVLGSYDDLM